MKNKNVNDIRHIKDCYDCPMGVVYVNENSKNCPYYPNIIRLNEPIPMGCKLRGKTFVWPKYQPF